MATTPQQQELKESAESQMDSRTAGRDGPAQQNLENETGRPITRADLKSRENRIRLTNRDDENDLDLYCYTKCGSTDDDVVKRCRGLVFHGDELVLQGFPFNPEFNDSEVDKILEALGDFKECRFFDAHEGAVIRVFNFNGKWFVSTHRKIDAFTSKWSSPESFGEIFLTSLEAEVENNDKLRNYLPNGENLLQRFFSTLNPDRQYMFLIRNTKDNRIVCLAPQRPTLYHVGTFVDGELDLDDNVGVPHPKEHRFLNVDELARYASGVDMKEMQGVVAFLPGNNQVKVLNERYQYYFHLRGNEASVKYRYLHVRMSKRQSRDFHELYPEHTKIFEEYEDIIYEIARNLHRAYVNRFINHHYVRVPYQQHLVISECHKWHVEDRKNNRITLNKVIEVMNSMKPSDLNAMIRQYRIEKAQQKEQHSRNQKVTPKSAGRSGRTPANTPVEDGVSVSSAVSPMLLPSPAVVSSPTSRSSARDGRSRVDPGGQRSPQLAATA